MLPDCPTCFCVLEADDLYPERMWCWNCTVSWVYDRDRLIRVGRR